MQQQYHEAVYQVLDQDHGTECLIVLILIVVKGPCWGILCIGLHCWWVVLDWSFQWHQFMLQRRGCMETTIQNTFVELLNLTFCTSFCSVDKKRHQPFAMFVLKYSIVGALSVLCTSLHACSIAQWKQLLLPASFGWDQMLVWLARIYANTLLLMRYIVHVHSSNCHDHLGTRLWVHDLEVR